jgi:hypothetical protein
VSISTTKCAIRDVRSNAIGLYGISLKFIKLFLPLVMSPVTHIFNTSISRKTFPGAWKRGLISEFQSGFMPGHSTTIALLKVTDDISVELERVA